MSVEQYAAKFTELSRYTPHIIDTEALKASKFERGLRPNIKGRIISANLKTFSPLVDLALKIERDYEDFRVRREGRLGVALPENFKRKARRPLRRELKGRNDQGGVRIQRAFLSDVRGNRCPICSHCGLSNHTAAECFRKTRAYFQCGKPGHLVKDCPIKGPEDRPRTQGRVFALTEQEAKALTSVIRGTLSICGIEARILINPGSFHSFVAPHFACHMNVKSEQLDWTLVLCTPMGGYLEIDIIFKHCGVVLKGHVLPIDLILVDIQDFDIILGMDWLSTYYATINYHDKTVTFRRSN
ncbi:uncharacterized protein LOC105421390 [Amborella trichopoda]|uniref:uncharacterized protein LOC105421390 n=1 Tax=Amborella trichopoda TaxID=13333 RepID=UPI0005D39B38|nr:uncharacterized protein LOC105421390 [Amborella trichopoda]|eukprot:XP_011626954.1 uncharacterized protein LOC105421390 [Amborella trichopoda]